ncbi:MAG: transporter substrate-binding domain-containing protein [Sphaerochaetaceae bacterium]|jgi:polar amino acid transport system substrate-binding protein|nr:transporter substrate-binding domain-containing protein [Sphaerochaetaceae bacterium]MDD4841002.1 transporter substrate-binding domain-containing protein [Sphaerochaetaceae bacterium]NLO61756.1 transporter substrate-binding domain-containing protein [Spirochaetales bacterium]
MKRVVLAMIIIACISVSLFGAGAKETPDYVFATDATWPPMQFIDEAGALVGFEVDLVHAIGKAVGKNFEVKNVPWETIFAGLYNGAYDAVSSGVTVTEERKLEMNFSTPILNVGQVVITTAAKSSSYSSIDDFSGKKIGVQMGTTGDISLESYPVERRAYDDIGLAIEDMLNGNVEGVVCDSLIASDFVLANKNYQGKLVVIGAPFTEEDIAIAVNKKDAELLKLVNEGLIKIEQDGTLAELKKKWNIL